MGEHVRRDIEARLLAAGAGQDEIDAVDTIDGLVELSGVVALRPAGDRLTLREVAARSGVEVDRTRWLFSVAGLRVDDVDEVAWFTSDADWVRDVEAASAVFGEAAATALLRRAGASTAQLAHAAGSAFRVNIVGREGPGDASAVAQVDRNLGARHMVDIYLGAVSQLFLHNVRGTIRSESVAAGAYGELRAMCVGFVDLASSTELGERVTAHELATLIAEFDTAAFALATEAGARVVKTIGDEVMLCADAPRAVMVAARGLVAFCQEHRTFSAARAGLAHGDVLEQDGDCYGPVVNLAARLADAAADGSVVADRAAASLLRADAAATVTVIDLPSVEVRGIGTVAWARIDGPAG